MPPAPRPDHRDAGDCIDFTHFMDDAEVGMGRSGIGPRFPEQPGAGFFNRKEPFAVEPGGDGRSRWWSQARKTRPMPPAPIFSRRRPGDRVSAVPLP